MHAIPLRRVLLLGVLALAGLWPLARAVAADTPTLKRVLLSTGGVGYFEFEAKVSGNDELSLPVRVDQIDDILKSLVVFDSKGGVGTVSLPSRLSEAELFRDLPFDAGALTSMGDLMARLVGAEIPATGPRYIQGRIVGVTSDIVTTKAGEVRTIHRVSVLGNRGLEQFVLEDARTISFRDKKLQVAFSRALAELAQRGSDIGRTLTITSRGEGARTLTIGYVVSAPLWKSAYRLVLPDATATDSNADKGRLQGWAILENASGLDWKNVQLTLASGNPVTFRQALYDAYYVERPEVPVEVLGRVLPKPDTGGVAYGEGRGYAAAPKAYPPPSPAPAMADGYGYSAAEEAPPPPPEPAQDIQSIIVTARRALASSDEATSQVMFRLKDPVTVGRGQSLAVPVIDQLLPARRVAFYDRDTHETRPLAAVRLSNDGDSGLPPGVLTLYEATKLGNSFIGDARLSPLPKGDTRFISYAVDEKAIVDSEDSTSQRIEKGKISGGVLEISVVEQEATIYTVKAPTNEPRDLVLEHPRSGDEGEMLTAPKGADIEQTQSAYRIPFHVDAGATASLRAVVERPISRTLALVDLSGDSIETYLHSKEISPELTAIFTELARLRAPIDEAGRTQRRIDGERQRIYEDQERLRKNLEAVPNGALKSRYLDQMNEQEDRLAELKTSAREADAAKDKALVALKAYVAKLEL